MFAHKCVKPFQLNATQQTNKQYSQGDPPFCQRQHASFSLEDIEPAKVPTNPPIMMLIHPIQQPAVLLPGSLILPDPYETYLQLWLSGMTPELLVVAKQSSVLHAIFLLVDNQQHVEGILDPGSQIIAMAEEVCIDFGSSYTCHSSANSEADPSLRHVQNIPMCIGDITVYMQIHIICSPTYNILLGFPFNILTESVMCKFANEYQIITVNTKIQHNILTELCRWCIWLKFYIFPG